MNVTCSPEQYEACPGRMVCRCLQVTEQEVVTMVATLGLREVHEVRTMTGAGDGCTCCHDEINKILTLANSPVYSSRSA